MRKPLDFNNISMDEAALLHSADIHLFLGDIKNATSENIVGRLSPDEIQRMQTWIRPARRAQFAMGRFLLRNALDLLLGSSGVAWRITDAPGKPRLSEIQHIEFSLAHSANLVLCAIARQPIGIDIEIERARPHMEMARFICSPSEWQSLLGLPEATRASRFQRLWLLKEAAFKAFGEPEGQPAWCFSMSERITTCPEPICCPNPFLCLFTPKPGFEAALAADTPPAPRVLLRHWNLARHAWAMPEKIALIKPV